jgi:hypothetical protein
VEPYGCVVWGDPWEGIGNANLQRFPLLTLAEGGSWLSFDQACSIGCDSDD